VASNEGTAGGSAATQGRDTTLRGRPLGLTRLAWAALALLAFTLLARGVF